MATKNRLVITVSLFIISLFVVVALTSWFILSVFSQTVVDSIKKVYQSQAQSMGDSIGAQFFERYSDVKAVSGALEALKGEERSAAAQLLSSYASLYRLYDLILFVDEAGNVVVHNTKDISQNNLPLIKLSREEVRSSKWFSQTISRELTEDINKGLTGVFFEISSQDPALKYLPRIDGQRAIFSTQATLGKTKGVLVAYARLSWMKMSLEDQYAKFVNLGLGDSSIRVLTEQGQVLSEVGPSDMAKRVFNPNLGISVEAAIESNRLLGSLRWRVEIFTPNSEVQNLLQYWKRYYIIVAVIFLGLVSMVTVYFGKQFKILSEQYDQALIIRNELEDRVKERTIDLENNLNEIKVMQKKLIAQEKMAGLGVLATGLAHEIKNPLNIVTSSAQILKESFEGGVRLDKAEATEFCGMILKHSDRIDALVRSILVSAKKNVGPRSEIDLSDLVMEMVDATTKSFKAQHKLELPTQIQILRADCRVVMHVEDCRRILANLLDNAVFSLIKKWGLDNIEKAMLKIALDRKGELVVLTIEDNGVGISRYAQENIFTPFFTTKDPGQGTGLGLSMSLDLAKKYGGRLYFDSVEGEYCKFYLEVPYGRV